MGRHLTLAVDAKPVHTLYESARIDRGNRDDDGLFTDQVVLVQANNDPSAGGSPTPKIQIEVVGSMSPTGLADGHYVTLYTVDDTSSYQSTNGKFQFLVTPALMAGEWPYLWIRDVAVIGAINTVSVWVWE